MSKNHLSDIVLSYTDLLSERYGGQALSCNDEFFAETSNLMKAEEPVFIHGKYTDRGKWMDGWESRRRRSKGYDWCIVRLGIAGQIKAFNVNTTHFKGNAPASVIIEACQSEQDPDETTQWEAILDRSDVDADSHNFFSIEDDSVWTHLRLKIFPDGGVARLRVYGEAVFDKRKLLPNELVDLAACTNGGRAIDCSDMFFSPMNNLIAPNRGANMGDGWETKRRRQQGDQTFEEMGNDWIVIKLACLGNIARVIVDTCHFKGNYPDRFSLEAIKIDESEELSDELIHNEEHSDKWTPLLNETKLFAHREHFYQEELLTNDPFTHIRLNIYPDGGVSRLRVWGYPG